MTLAPTTNGWQYQVNDRVSEWGMAGDGASALSLTTDGQSALQTGVSMAMVAAGNAERTGRLSGHRALRTRVQVICRRARSIEPTGTPRRVGRRPQTSQPHTNRHLFLIEAASEPAEPK